MHINVLERPSQSPDLNPNRKLLQALKLVYIEFQINASKFLGIKSENGGNNNK